MVPLRSLDIAAGNRRNEKRSSVTSLSNDSEPAPAPTRTHSAAPEKTSSRNKLFSIAKKSCTLLKMAGTCKRVRGDSLLYPPLCTTLIALLCSVIRSDFGPVTAGDGRQGRRL